MSNVIKPNFKKRDALAMTCTACGAAGVAGCDCGVPYERAQQGIAQTPDDTNVAIAERMGVSEKTVRRAREASTKSAHAEMSSRTKRAEAAIAETPEATNVAIAKRLGVSEITVRRARKAVDDETATRAKPEPRKPPKPPKVDMSVIKQAGAFHNELLKYTMEFCARIQSWHAAHQIDEESHHCVVQALEMASMRLRRMAQEIDGR
ncbi:DNA-binding Lrp family transcriptional regulator [Nitrobacteraceae bacterium AZCC 2161]